MVNVIKRTHFKNRTETRFDTLGHAAGRVHTTLPRTHHHNTGSESEASVLEDGIRGENGPIKTQTPSSSLQDMFIPQPDAKLSLSWED
ncbi:hypothetical protein VNI00_010739 [Paramarasmius palmivorus]|uniref:Uncharacterized protein n=1 Tax=Paramarasmius palmivorus TaxID=297713 RepID=A0AAW0CG78_9AGAR